MAMHFNLLRCFLLILFALNYTNLVGTSSAEVQVFSDTAKAGTLIAKKYCSKCHAIGNEQTSQHKSAPTFVDISTKWPLSYLEEALAEGITVGHPDMPEFKFTPTEIESLLSFMQWLGDQKEPR